jgi:hypothetical protein
MSIFGCSRRSNNRHYHKGKVNTTVEKEHYFIEGNAGSDFDGELNYECHHCERHDNDYWDDRRDHKQYDRDDWVYRESHKLDDEMTN